LVLANKVKIAGAIEHIILWMTFLSDTDIAVLLIGQSGFSGP